MGLLVKIGFPCHTLAVRLGSGSYVHCVTMGRTSNHETVHPFQSFQGEPHFFSIVRLFSNS